jgi:hypothetical protein
MRGCVRDRRERIDTMALPKAKPVWTAWPAVTDDGIPMARVKLDVGQYSFQAGSQYSPEKDDFAERVANVIRAITVYAREQRWID